MRAERYPGRLVVGHGQLPAAKLAQARRRRHLERQRELLAEAGPTRPRGDTQSPQRRAPRRRRCASLGPTLQRVAGTRPGEALERIVAHAGAGCEPGEVTVGPAALALGHERLHLLGARTV